MDNSVRSLYEARKVESKLAQRQMLDIVNPNVVSVEAIRKNFKDDHRNLCDYCGHSHVGVGWGGVGHVGVGWVL